jgi:hypothetical protein
MARRDVQNVMCNRRRGSTGIRRARYEAGPAGSEALRVDIIALVIWAGTACFGLYLLGVWLSHGGLRQQTTRITVFPAVLIFAHPVLATTGLTFWITFMLTGRVLYAWCGFGVLSASAMLGFVMLTRWLVGRGGRHARGAEQHFPARVVAMHGMVGLTTFAIVLIAATLATQQR